MKQTPSFHQEGELNRREFIKVSGSGIFITFTFGTISPLAAQRQGGSEYPDDFNAYLKIGEDGRVACTTGKIEMGQGIITSLAQMLAEELDLTVDHVDMVMGDTAMCPFDNGTVGSRSTKYFGPYLRRAAAEAKNVLMEMAGEALGVAVDQLNAHQGVIFDKNHPSRQISYAELAKGKRIERRAISPALPKRVEEHQISGKSARRTDAWAKVTGEALYTGDIRPANMLFAQVLRPPAHGARRLTVDIQSAVSLPEVQMVSDGDLIAALSDSPDAAMHAIQMVQADYEMPPLTLDAQSIFAHLQASATTVETVAERGDVEEGRAKSDKTITLSFYNHYVAHAPLEPHTVVIDPGHDPIRVWASTQTPFAVRRDVARVFNVTEEHVRVFPVFVGGGFGGKKSGPDIQMCARLAKLTQRPIQLMYTRKDEFFYDTFRPAAVINIEAGIDRLGKLQFWHYENYYAGARSSEPIYQIPHYRVLYKSSGRNDKPAHPFGTGAWRGPGSNTNVFAIESQIDILAQTAGLDPLTFRLHNLTDDRMRKVLHAAAEQFGGSFSPAPSHRGVGIACTNYLGTYVAMIAKIRVDETRGQIHVERVVCAQDMGEIINPQGARLQIEGGITMGLGYAFSEAIHFQGGKILDENFDTYEIPRFHNAPAVEVVLVDNPDLPPQGCGEPAITTVGAVMANALYDALGIRSYELPVTKEKILNRLTESPEGDTK